MGLPALVFLGLLLFHGGVQLTNRQQSDLSFQRSFVQAALFRSHGEFEKSLVALQEALSISRRTRLADQEGKCLIRMGILQWDLGNIPESARHFDEAATAFKKVWDRRSQEFCAKCLELIELYDQGKDDRAARFYHRSLKRFEDAFLFGREIGIPDLQLKCLRQEALTYLDMGKLEPFLESSKRGLDIAKKINHKIEQGRFLNNIGVFYQQRDEFSQAVVYFENALAVIREAHDRTTEAECLNNLGLAYRELGNLSRAIFYLSAALDLDKRAANANSLSIDLENIGTVSLRKGIEENRQQELIQALDAFRACLLLQNQREPDPFVSFTALNNMGIILNELTDHAGARLQFEQAMKYLGDEEHARERCHVLNNIGTSFLDEHNIEKALDCFRLSFELGSKHSFEGALLESGYGLGQCYEIRQEFASALSFYRRAIEALESMRARITAEPFMIGYARNKFGPYEKAIDILAHECLARPSAGRLEEMFDLVERAKARAFLESVNDARVDVVEADMLILKKRQQSISKNISDLSLKLADRSVSSDAELALKNELELEEEEYVRLISEMKAPRQTQEDRWGTNIQRLGDIQRLLRADDAVLLEYALGEQRSYLMAISPICVKLFLVPAREKIEISLRAYLKLLSNRSLDPRAGFQAAERIGRELFPLDRDEDFRNAKAIIVIPDGILHYLPFEALRIHHGAVSKYLVESAAVSYCPSASALALLKSPVHRGRWKRDLLALGGPHYIHGTKTTIDGDGIELAPLVFSKKEVLDIARLYPPDTVDILLGNAATEDNVKKLLLKDYRIIHFACHGFLDERYPYRSALALSLTDASGEDGFLQMREIYGLTMKAELVVLSACQTGKGPLERSEGPMGLARPFFFAGARSVIASLWPINDKASVVFMREFYSRLKGGYPANEALRGAKRKMLSSKWRHPFYWASFMLQGDPSATGTMARERGVF